MIEYEDYDDDYYDDEDYDDDDEGYVYDEAEYYDDDDGYEAEYYDDADYDYSRNRGRRHGHDTTDEVVEEVNDLLEQDNVCM